MSMLRSLQRLTGVRNFSESFTIGANAYYVESMYIKWKQEPSSVHVSWRAYFEGLEQGNPTPFIAAPSLGVSVSSSPSVVGKVSESNTRLTVNALLIHRAYQNFGYMLADLDPLKLQIHSDYYLLDQRVPGHLRLENYKISEEDMGKQVDIGSDLVNGFRDSKAPRQGKWTIRELLEACKQAYCGKIGFDYLHIPFIDECNWIRQHAEQMPQFTYSSEEKLELYTRIAKGHLLEQFFHRKFNSHKRFGMDGLEAVVLSVEAIIEKAAQQGIDNFIIGMPHRGRLSVMIHNANYDLEDIFKMFFGVGLRYVDEGDVKYHLGIDTTRIVNGKEVNISLLANPSHLEAVDGVTLGKTRAWQNKGENVLAIMLHGDAALSGQGVVYEAVQMEHLKGYGTQGVIHVVLNNNIGFTTTPREGRTGLFPTEIAKSLGAPVFHVNGDCPEEIDFVSRMAADWKTKFRKSAFIDIIGYRRYGHNELDEPLFTNPKMYQLIHSKKTCFEIYSEKLLQEGVLTTGEESEIKAGIVKTFEKAFSQAKNQADTEASLVAKNFLKWRSERVFKSDPSTTGLPVSYLQEIGEKINILPEDVRMHPNIKKIYKARAKAIAAGEHIDWGTSEALAWATILAHEKADVRISGQDVQRGTFSHRHAVVNDQTSDMKKYVPLNHIQESQGKFEAINSHLSEFGVLGFEYGYTLGNPSDLVIWEAQFGDFANGAQVIIDQFITSGQAKWGQESGIVLLLPHGYDGQGAEHSCGRPGRLLQMFSEGYEDMKLQEILDKKECYSSNFQLAMPTSPANYFHFLRRQVARDFRRPLFVMSPKKLLRHREAVSNIQEFAEGTVNTMYDETFEIDYPENIRKLIMCSGQVYFDLTQERTRRGIKDIAIVRMEQICPFPFDKVFEFAKKYKNAQVVWTQEEPKNLGPWYFVVERINKVLLSLGRDPVTVASRPVSAAAATGYLSVHNEELRELIENAFS